LTSSNPSCPLDPAQRSDSACIERIDAAKEYRAHTRAAREAARSAGRSYVPTTSRCYEPPRFRYVVHARNPAFTREAQALLVQALHRIESQPLDAPLREALAHARFLQAEPRFEAALARRLPPGLSFDPNRPRTLAASKARFSAWLEARAIIGKLQPREHPLYDAVLAYNVPTWSMASRSRLLQLFLDLDDQINRYPYKWSPPPPSKQKEPYDELWCEPSDSFPRELLRDALNKCYNATTDLTRDNPYARTCLDLGQTIDPYWANEAPEIFASRTWQTPLAQVRYAPGGSVE
jgi:hypothetical protein